MKDAICHITFGKILPSEKSRFREPSVYCSWHGPNNEHELISIGIDRGDEEAEYNYKRTVNEFYEKINRYTYLVHFPEDVRLEFHNGGKHYNPIDKKLYEILSKISLVEFAMKPLSKKIAEDSCDF